MPDRPALTSADRALARLHVEARDFTYWAAQDGTDYAVARLHAALTEYHNATEEQP